MVQLLQVQEDVGFQGPVCRSRESIRVGVMLDEIIRACDELKGFEWGGIESLSSEVDEALYLLVSLVETLREGREADLMAELESRKGC